MAENWITNRLPAGQKLPLSHMTLLPLFHMACFVCVMSYPPAGWALNLCGDIRDFYRDLGLMHSDVMASAPMLVETIYNDYKRGRVERLNGLWDLCCSSAALDPKMLEELAANGFVVNQCYGMTETFGDGILNFTQTADHMSAVGKPDDHCEYQLDETGEICIRGNSVMLGYYKDPEATAEVIDKDGWFHTGDLGRIDEDGYYYITGRKKNLIILANGENVSPEELEHKLAACPAVQECIVKEKEPEDLRCGLLRKGAAGRGERLYHRVQPHPAAVQADQRRGVHGGAAAPQRSGQAAAQGRPEPGCSKNKTIVKDRAARLQFPAKTGIIKVLAVLAAAGVLLQKKKKARSKKNDR